MVSDVLDKATDEVHSYLEDAAYKKTYAPVSDELRRWIVATQELATKIEMAENPPPPSLKTLPDRETQG
jgi:hypothetical protein